MKSKDLELHISIVGWLYILGNILYLVVGGLGLIFLASIGIAVQDVQAFRVLSVVGGIGALFFTILAIPGLLAGYGLLKRKSWARILAIVLAVFGLVNFPIGTIISVYALWVLLPTEACDCFPAVKAA